MTSDAVQKPSVNWDQQFSNLSSALKAAAEIHCSGWPQDNGELNIAEGVRQTLRLAFAGYLCFLESNPDYPELLKQESLVRDFMCPSADAVYHYARLHGRNSYRIRGSRGSAHLFQMTIWNGSCSDFRNDYYLVDKMESDESDYLAEGGEIDIVLSAAPHDGPWLRLPEGDCEIFIRQYYRDWDTEEPARLTIEREGAVYPPPLPKVEDIAEGMGMLNSWLEANSDLFAQSVRFHLDADPERLPVLAIPEAMQGVTYMNGHYHCRPGEAVILEMPAPTAHYWCFQLLNLQWERMDVHMRQSSLNFRQAKIDGDGKLRLVISHTDPGVANWLDAGGRTLGLITGRLFKAEHPADASLKKVPFDDLPQHLPQDTARVSNSERQGILRSRWASAYRRLCGDQ